MCVLSGTQLRRRAIVPRTEPRVSAIRLPTVLLLGGCSGVSFAPSAGFNGYWYGPQKITFTGGDYEINGRPGHFGSDANTIYFTPSSLLPGADRQITISCPYTLVGDTLALRNCPYAGEYRR
jgi:hypothetical protein